MYVGNTTITIKLEARRHSVYNGTQKPVCETEITYVRVDGDGDAIPLSNKVKEKFKNETKKEEELYEVYGGD